MAISHAAISQVAFEGLVKDGDTNQPLAYVNIGIKNKSNGTVTDASGKFTIKLTDDSDSLKISMIGYAPQIYKVSDFKQRFSSVNAVLLKPAIIQLKAVKVSNKKLKESILGNTTQSKSTNAGFTSNKLGNEIGAIIKIKRAPTFLKRFNVSLTNEVSSDVKLRLNIYSVKNGFPEQILSDRNIFVTVLKGAEKISVDLEPYGIIVDGDFFVSLEWIENSRGHGLMFSASLFSSPIIARETSQAAWEKVGLAGVGFNVLAEY
ncbi:hypothetical protein GS399_14100 [Pedobacter sp. HMF7647]|uniref:Carboxypeptidase-like regulatory domain-containing protein n=1 Tax=Hufsiella arboris TaxID=2695275 RepID=A0A7K1YBZ1_9SPHI|nr:carboxypeptidase-like regulatory domain-containing protein [Hufsiella arboris]MXV52107.1 hypothetical protein [Hufsiella arboris]